jgi:class 3 adenylate cyclase
MAVPTFHAIVVVDIEGFGPRTNPLQASLRQAMYDVVREACAEVRIEWDTTVALDRGDGIILLVPPAASTVTIAGQFMRAVDAVLAEKAAIFSDAHRMRFRVALHQGLCQQDETGWIGEAINTACRLVDAQPVRDALTAAPEARMALVVSDEIYRAVIRHGYRLIDPAAFARVAINAKELVDETAWITVPGRSYPPGIASEHTPPATGPRPPIVANGQATGIVNNSSVTVHGDQIGHDKIVKPS